MGFVEVALLTDLPEGSQKIFSIGSQKIALFHFDGKIIAIGNACLHKAGPLGQGLVEKKYDGYYVTCPWHGWEYNIKTGTAPPGYLDQQALYEVKIEDGKIFVSEKPIVKAKRAVHDTNPLEDLEKLKYETTPDSLNILGISTTNMNENLPRISTSENALIKNKVAGFIITGGQDNVQQVAAQMMVFFTDLGLNFPPFSFVGWSRGWTAEDMENNVQQFSKSKYIDRSIKELTENSIRLSRQLKKNPIEEMDTPLPKIGEAAGMMKDTEN